MKKAPEASEPMKLKENAQDKNGLVRVLLPSVPLEPIKAQISESDILFAEQQRILEENESPRLKTMKLTEVGSIDSLLHNRISKEEKLNIYVNLLRFIGTVEEAKKSFAKCKGKDIVLQAQIMLSKLKNVFHMLGEEDLNLTLLSVINKRSHEIGIEIKKVLPDAIIPNYIKNIENIESALKKPCRPK